MSNVIRTVPAIFAAAFAATATLTANAANLDWTGGQTGVDNTESSPYNIWNPANWSGAFDYWNSLDLTVSGKTYIQSQNGNDVIGADLRPNSGDFVFMGPLKFLCVKGGAANKSVSILKKGDWTVASQYHFFAAYEANSKFTMTNETGNVTLWSGSALYVGNGANSEAEIVNISGDWTIPNFVNIGKGSDSVGSFIHNSGTLTANGVIDVGCASGAKGTLIVNGGTVDAKSNLAAGAGGNGTIIVNGGNVSVSGILYVPYSGNGTMIVKGGTVSVGNNDLQLSNGGTGTLTIEGGKVTVSNTSKSVYIPNGTGTINLNGGILETPCIYRNAGTATVNFNGGTLTANYSKAESVGLIYGYTVNVGANGGVIDCGGHDITIKSNLGQTSDTGGLTFSGGNGNTISIPDGAAIQYKGITTITPGTRLAQYNWNSSKNVISNGIEVAGIPGVGQVIFTCTRGYYNDELKTLEGVSLDNVTCSAAVVTFGLDDSKTNIVVKSVVGVPGFWTGAANDGNLSNPANWSDNAVPAPGTNATIFCATPATLTTGASFAPASITFAEGCAAVTINGDDIAGIVAVTNLSSVSHTINAKVYFTGDIQVKQAAMGDAANLSKAHVTFAGGAYAADGCSLESGNFTPIYSRCVFGKYYLANTSSSRWTVLYQGSSMRVCVADGSYLYVPYAGVVNALYVGNGAKVDIGDMATTDRPSYQVKGEMVVTNLTMSGSATDKYISWDQGTSTPGVFKFNSVTNAMGNGYLFYLADANAASKHTFYIGAGGLNFSAGNTTAQYVIGRITDGNYETIRPWYSDFTIAGRSDGKGWIILCRNVEFCTDDASGVGRTITIDAITRGSVNHVPKITVSGSGTLKVTQPPDNGNQPIVAVTDSATLEYAAGATFGTGAMTLGAGTTLALTATSSTFTALSNAVTLPTGENEKAKIRIDGHRLTCGPHTILSNVTGSADNVEVDLSGTALDGRRASLEVKEGNLVLTVKTGLMFFVR